MVVDRQQIIWSQAFVTNTTIISRTLYPKRSFITIFLMTSFQHISLITLSIDMIVLNVVMVDWWHYLIVIKNKLNLFVILMLQALNQYGVALWTMMTIFLVLSSLIQFIGVPLVLLKIFILVYFCSQYVLSNHKIPKIVIVGNLNIPNFNRSLSAVIGSEPSYLHFLSYLYEQGLPWLNNLSTWDANTLNRLITNIPGRITHFSCKCPLAQVIAIPFLS